MAPRGTRGIKVSGNEGLIVPLKVQAVRFESQVDSFEVYEAHRPKVRVPTQMQGKVLSFNEML